MNSREPIIGISGEGRNNIAGSSYLYVASDPQTACMEVKSTPSELISLAEFELLKDMEMIDFGDKKEFNTNDYDDFGINIRKFISLLMLRFSVPVKGDNAYKATQLISDYIRKTGVNGIAYNSFFVAGGVNYTIFNCHPSNIKFCNSKILIHKQANHSFWDLNDDKAIMSNSEQNLLFYDENIAGQHKKHLLLTLNHID